MMKSTRRLFGLGLALAVAIAALGMSGCATQSQSPPATAQAPATAQSPVEKVKALAVTIDKHCQIGLPFLATLKLAQTDAAAIAMVDKVQTDAGKVCAVVAVIAHPPQGAALPTLDLATIKAFADSQVPNLMTLVNGSNMPDSQKTAAKLAISGIQLALLTAVVNAQ